MSNALEEIREGTIDSMGRISSFGDSARSRDNSMVSSTSHSNL